MITRLIPATLVALLLVACNEPETSISPAVEVDRSPAAFETGSCEAFDENGTALFGDLHIHTSYSFDAAANSTGATPEDAHRYARGEEIPIFPINDQGVAVGRTRIDRPLDFLAVTDHGEFLGERALCRTAGSPVYDSQFCSDYRSDERQGNDYVGDGYYYRGTDQNSRDLR